LFFPAAHVGEKHDKKAADEAGYQKQMPEGSRLLQDTGFQGFDAGVS